MVGFLNTRIECPVWFPVMAVLVGAVVGMAILLLAAWLSGRGHKTKISDKADNAARVGQPSIVKQSAPTQISLSPEQRTNLESRAKIDGGYHVADLVRMLGVPEKDIMRWIKSKKLALYTDNYKQTWVTAVSVLNLVNELGGATKMDRQSYQRSIEQLPQPPKLGTEVAKVATVPHKLPPFRQHYWYTVDGSDGRYATLREVLKVAGCPLTKGANPDWKKIPSEVKGKIHREKI